MGSRPGHHQYTASSMGSPRRRSELQDLSLISGVNMTCGDAYVSLHPPPSQAVDWRLAPNRTWSKTTSSMMCTSSSSSSAPDLSFSAIPLKSASPEQALPSCSSWTTTSNDVQNKFEQLAGQRLSPHQPALHMATPRARCVHIAASVAEGSMRS